MESDAPPQPRSALVAALQPAGKLAALGALLICATVATVVIGAWGANRPHELRGVWLFHSLLAANAVVCILVLAALVRAWRARESRGLRARHLASIVLSVGYAGFVLWYFGMLLGLLVR